MSYSYAELLSYKSKGTFSDELTKYCCQNSTILTIHNDYQQELTNIIAHIMNGKDPDILAFANRIKEYFNKLNHKNICETIQKLKSLKMDTIEYINIFVEELVVRSFEIIMGDLLIQIVSEFNTTTDNIIDNINQKLYSKNNTNIEGLYNFIGLLFQKNMISSKTVLEYIKQITQCNHYDKIMNGVLKKYELNKSLDYKLLIELEIINTNLLNKSTKRIEKLTFEDIQKQICNLNKK